MPINRVFLSLLFIVIASPWGRANDDSVLDLLDKAKALVDKQNSIVLKPSDAFLLTTEISTPENKQEHLQNAFVFGEQGCLMVCKHARDIVTTSYVYLQNAKYGAMLTPLAKRESDMSPILLNQRGSSYKLDTFWQSNPQDVNRRFVIELSGRYLGLGNITFSEALKEWKAKQGKFDLKSSDNPKLVAIEMKDWPFGDENRMTYWLDKSDGSIRMVEGFINKVQIRFAIDEMLDLHGVPFPRKTRLETIDPVNQQTLRRQGTLQPSDISKLGFDEAQLYLAYYDLPDPDVGALPRSSRSYWPLLLASTVLAGSALVFWRWKNR
jgi:hypothetical protein